MTRALVTGLGVVSPNGLGARVCWDSTVGLRSAIRPLRGDGERRLAGEVLDFTPEEWVPSRLLPQTDRMTRFALAAADWALADAGVDPDTVPALDRGVVTSSAFGGFDYGQRELQNLFRDGPDHVSAYMSFAWFYAVNTGQISIRNDLRGPTGVFVAEQAGGIDAIAQARRAVLGGKAMMLTGGMDSSLCPYGMAARLAHGGLSRETDPRRAYLPFDRDSGGYVPGEGGAILVLEEEARVRARKGREYGEVAGYGATFDPHPSSGRPSNLRRAVEIALDEAGLDPEDVSVVFADAMGAPEPDRDEAETLIGLFGPRGVPVTAPKTMVGRLHAGGAPLDVALALLALETGLIPPTANAVPRHDIDLVTTGPRSFSGTTALVVARGDKGFNSAMVIRGGRKDGNECTG